MRPGQYDDAGHKTLTQQLDDLFPEFDFAGEPYVPVMWERVTPYQHPVVFGVTVAGAATSADAWQPGGPPLPPPEESPPAAFAFRRLPIGEDRA